jgi:GTP-binding protein Era
VSVQVQVVEYNERKTGKDYVKVVVYVEQDSQKGIMVGRGGSALKAMATAARADIEDFVGMGPCQLETLSS